MSYNLFEYCILYIPKRTKKDEETGEEKKAELIKPITSIIARDDKEVAIIAARHIPQEYMEKLDQVHIKIRAF